MNTTTVLFYSKYSSYCQQLFNEISQYDIFKNILQLVCIDNDEIRAKILGDDKLKIQTVPCILAIHPDGIVEKFDSDSAFSWCRNVISQQVPVQPVYQNIPKAQPIQSKQKPAKRSDKSNKSNKSKKKVKFTDIENVISSDSEQEHIPIKKPPKSIRKDKGNIEFEDDTFGYEGGESQPQNLRAIKDSTSSGGSDIMNKMAAIMKEREQADSNMPKRPFPGQ